MRALARAFEVPLTLLKRTTRQLAALGYLQLEGDSVTRGASFDFLDEPRLREAIGARAAALDISVLGACESTNSLLLEQPAESRAARFVITEEQTAGRGRRERKWLSAIGHGITCSLGVRFSSPPRQLSGLSLAAGVAAARALRAAGAPGVALKWPNDLMAGHAKLGGILIETRATGAGIAVVIGIGINYRPQPGLGERLRRKVTSLAECLQPLPSRNDIAGAIVRELLAALEEFRDLGLDSVRSEWESMHAFAGHRLRVRLADGRVVAGRADGLGRDGALLLRTRAGVTSIASGQVISARLA